MPTGRRRPWITCRDGRYRDLRSLTAGLVGLPATMSHMQLPSGPAGLYVKPWPPVLATRGPGSLRELHAHHATHFVLAQGGDLRIRTSSRGRWTRVAGALTSPDAPHAIDTRGVDMLVIFLDSES